MLEFFRTIRRLATPTRSIPKTAWSAAHPWELSIRRVAMLYFGLFLLGLGGAIVVQSGLGNAPWTVLAQGISLQTDLTLGMSFFITSVLVLLLWIPLKLKPGFGTLSNAVVFAITLQTTLSLITPPDSFLLALLAVFGGIILVGAGTAIYVTCSLGGGPRDGLMIGIVQKTSWRVAYIRSGIEGTVLVLGFLLGGTVGIGTILSVFLAGWSISIWFNLLHKFAPASGQEFIEPEF